MSVENTKYLYNSLIKGDSSGILQIYKLVFPKVASFVMRNSGQREDAEDIFQKTLMQIAARFKEKEVEFTSSFEAYLFTACKNQWRRTLNSQKKRVTNHNNDEPTNEYEEKAYVLAEEEKWKLYYEKFDLLSDNCKEVLKLFFQKISYARIVEELSYSSESVARQRVFKCRNKLSSLIKKDSRFSKIKSL